MNPHSAAFRIGAVFGALFVGMLCGLIPLAIGSKRERPGLGWTGFGLCTASGLVLGLIGALPMAGLMSAVIFAAGRPAKKANRPDTAPKPRTPAPEPYDF